MSSKATVSVRQIDYRAMLIKEINERKDYVEMLSSNSMTKAIITREQNVVKSLCEKVTKLDDKIGLTVFINVPLDYVLKYGD